MPRFSELSDRDAVCRVLDGDPECFGVLVERYRLEFGRVATALCGDPDLAADAMQDAFIRAYDALGSCQNPDRFGSWFFRILVNQCHNSRARQRRFEGIEAVEARSDADPARDAERAELRRALARGLDVLTAEQREAFVMKQIDGRSYAEMAELLDTGVDALKMRVYRARDLLRTELERVR